MPRGKLLNGLVTQQKVLRAAVALFLEKGYTRTTTGEISKAAGIGQSSFFHVFPSKEALLLELVKRMFGGQFDLAEQHSGEDDPVFLYAVETALQLHIAELTEPLRELYVMAYSLPSIAAYLYKSTTKRLQVIFGPYLPEAQPKDFYEMEIASASIMRGFMSVPCDVYFTMDAKISRFLDCSLKLYDVPKEKRAAITAAVLQMDLHTMALGIIQKTVRQAEKGFEALTEKQIKAREYPLGSSAGGTNRIFYGGATMKRKLWTLLLALGAALALCVGASAADFLTGWDEVTNSTTTLESGKQYYLNNDVTISQTITVSGTVTLDLNGHVLKYVSANEGSVIVVENGGQLTIEDSNTSNLSHIFNPNGKLWVLDEASGTETVTGGVITGGTGYPFPLTSGRVVYYGGGVYIAPGGQLTMTGGNIIGCSTEYGGGVCIDSERNGEPGQFSMSGGSIAGCVASNSGGGVYARAEGSVFNMSGTSAIHDCRCSDSGGGVRACGTFQMSGHAVIRNCTAESETEYIYGGGVYVNSSSSFVMSGEAKIEGCRAISNPSKSSNGGGVYLTNNTNFTLSGNAVIQNCTAANSVNSGEAYGGGVSAICMRQITLADSARIVGCTAANGSGLYITGSLAYPNVYGKLYANGGSVDGDVVLGDTTDGSCTITGSGRTVFKGKVTVTPGSTIESGTFNGEVINNGTITGGVFTGPVINNGTITGGVFNGTVTGSGTISWERKVFDDADFLAALADSNVTTIKLMEEIWVNEAENVKELTINRPITLVNSSRKPLHLNLPLTIAENGALTLDGLKGVVSLNPYKGMVVNGSLTVGAGCEVIFGGDQPFLTINQGGTVTTQPAGENTISGLLSLGKDAALTVNGALVNNGRLSVSNMENLKKAASIGGDLILDDITITEDYTLDMKDCTLTIGHITFLNANLTVKNASRVDATGVTISGGSYYCPVNVGNAEGVITGGSFYGPVTVKKISDATPAYIYGGTFYAELKGSYITKGCKVTFMNGSSQYAMQVVKDKASAPDTPVKSGYTFGGWYKDSTLQTPWDFANDTVTADTTLYAKWTANPPAPSYDDSDPTYAVSAPAAENGSVTVSPKNASAGSTVTITVKPDSGYVLETISVTDKNGNDLKLTDKGGGKYTFTMPASKVEVKATFMEDNSVLNFFYDVPNDAYYYEAVKWAAENGITGGVGNSLFAPNQPCTRAQIVTFLWRAAGSPVVNYLMPFTDVDEGAYYAEAVRWAASCGIVTGLTETTFGTNGVCTRAQAAAMIYRCAQAQGKGFTGAWMFHLPFTDVPEWAYESVAWCYMNGVTTGVSETAFAPGNDCTRAQIVTFLWRAFSK